MRTLEPMPVDPSCWPRMRGLDNDSSLGSAVVHPGRMSRPRSLRHSSKREPDRYVNHPRTRPPIRLTGRQMIAASDDHLVCSTHSPQSGRRAASLPAAPVEFPRPNASDPSVARARNASGLPGSAPHNGRTLSPRTPVATAGRVGQPPVFEKTLGARLLLSASNLSRVSRTELSCKSNHIASSALWCSSLSDRTNAPRSSSRLSLDKAVAFHDRLQAPALLRCSLLNPLKFTFFHDYTRM
jgi:hypothetical protein